MFQFYFIHNSIEILIKISSTFSGVASVDRMLLPSASFFTVSFSVPGGVNQFINEAFSDFLPSLVFLPSNCIIETLNFLP